MTARQQLIQQNLTQVDNVCPTQGCAKHRKMASSPFLFYRGSAPLFYQDLAQQVLNIPAPLYELPLTHVMGDCHTSNFGFLTEQGSHSDRVIFSPNDFDDACKGHAVWDISRFLTSLFLTAMHCQGVVRGDIASDKPQTGKIAATVDDAIVASNLFLKSYVERCMQIIEQPKSLKQTLGAFEKGHVLAKRYKKACKRAAGGELFTLESTLAKAVNTSSVPLSFASLEEKFKHVDNSLYQQIALTFSPYVDDCILDIVERVNAGTGSVNMPRYYLLVGPSNAGAEQLELCHLVEIKKQRPAAPLAFFSDISPVNRLNPAHLTVSCQRIMQNAADLVLDEVEWQGGHWLVRSRHHAKVSVKPEHIGMAKANPEDNLNQYAQACGHALALAHCRGDRRSNIFEKAVVSLVSEHAEPLIQACQHYSEQVCFDTQLLQQLLTQQD